MSSSFQSLSLLLERVEGIRKRLEIVDLVASYLKSLSSEEVASAVNMMVGRAFPKYKQKKLNVNWETVTRVLERTSQFDWNEFRMAMARTGDIGSATKAVLEQAKAKRQTQLTQKSLTILEVRSTFETIGQTAGSHSRTKEERQIKTMLSLATPVEAKYFVKIFTGEMRTGLQEGLVEQALAKAFDVPLSKVQHAGWF
jgi:DNA ligase 1